MQRSSGILLHISSLPSKYGIGNFGKEAYAFVDFLKKAGQSWWQILPISPTGYGDSPYQSVSTFAGNGYFIDLEALRDNGWLTEDELSEALYPDAQDRAAFERLYDERRTTLHKAYRRFLKAVPQDYDSFLKKHKKWLPEYALFMALKNHFGGKPWLSWQTPLRLHQKKACEEYQKKLADEIGYFCFTQYVFYAQWHKLHAYAKENGISIIGDIPIYVPMDSADVWSNPQNFLLTRTGKPTRLAGCPPDDFNRDGQFWGHPIYNWDRMENNGYAWWRRRVGAAAECFDMIRIDHFRGICSYWSVPARNKTARCGEWTKGPGMKLVDAIRSDFPHTEFIAEDLGFLTPEVHKLVKDSGFPSMKVLEFAFDPSEESGYLPHLYPENCICYTGTHDNETLRQFCDNLSAEEEAYARAYLKIGQDDDLRIALIEAGMRSKAKLFIAQMQDYLNLGGEARMNQPGIFKEQNWRFRMRDGLLTDALAAEILHLTRQSNRTQ